MMSQERQSNFGVLQRAHYLMYRNSSSTVRKTWLQILQKMEASKS